tara:strand:- start:7930 stop:8208 length:279 start_codon:yes stop_codon:yes gene_type:complete
MGADISERIHAAREWSSDPPTAYEIVQALGGLHRVAERCEVAVSTVGLWYRRGFPACRALRLQEIAQEYGRTDITLDLLLQSTPRPPRAPRA